MGLTPGKRGTLTDLKTSAQLLVTTNSKMNHVLESHSIKGHRHICIRPKKLDNVYKLVIYENTTHANITYKSFELLKSLSPQRGSSLEAF